MGFSRPKTTTWYLKSKVVLSLLNKHKKLFAALGLVLLVALAFPTTAFAITEGEVTTQVNAQGRDAVAGNLFIWVLCAISFLKISQKIDSFMASLGINVGHTGGSMLGEAMIAARGLQLGKGVAGAVSGHGGGGGSSGGGNMMSGGLAGVVGRQVNHGAAAAATGQGSGGIGGRMFASSMSKGGSFANGVIGDIAKGSIRYDGSISGDTAVSALNSYMGYVGQSGAPDFSDVEIGGGHIMGTETSEDYPGGVSFGMYYTDQYTAPSGDYSTVKAADGSKWYKQYATDHVEKKPFTAPDGNVAYKESIVKKLPDPPRRKDRI